MMMDDDFDSVAFERQVERELQPLYMSDTSPLAAMRMRSQTSNSLAWLGPMALVGAVVFVIFIVMPLLSIAFTQGMGWLAVLLLTPLLLYAANRLGKRNKEHQARLRQNQQHIVAELRLLQPEEQEWLLWEERVGRTQNLTIDEQARLLEQWEQAGFAQAEALLAREDVREVLCATLQDVSHDVFTIARTMTPVLLERVEEGQLLIPRVPVLFAASALLIHRQGVESLCTEPATTAPTNERLTDTADSA